MLINAKHDQDEFRGDARKDDADHHARNRGQQQNESANGLTAIVARPLKTPAMPNSTINAMTSQ